MAPLDISLKGKTAIITGGTKNLGGQTAHELARLGANISIGYNSASEEKNADAIIKEFKEKYGVDVIATRGNLALEEDSEKLFKATKDKFGSVDIAINNAGKVLKKPIGDVTTEEYESMFDINTKTSFQFLKSAYKYISDNGSIVFVVTSLLAAYCDGYGLYQGAKAPIEYFAKTASKELHSRGVSVSCVAPGPMDTPFLYGQETKESVAFFKTQGLGGRLTKVEDIVPIIRFLVTEGKWITGQTIYANGGFTAH